AAKNNPNFSWIKKNLLILFFQPEHRMYLWACRGAHIYTNGYHISYRLKKQGIHATPVISSTLTQTDFYFDNKKCIDPEAPKLLYVGYLRHAKGVETIIKAFHLIKNKIEGASLTLVGSG